MPTLVFGIVIVIAIAVNIGVDFNGMVTQDCKDQALSNTLWEI